MRAATTAPVERGTARGGYALLALLALIVLVLVSAVSVMPGLGVAADQGRVDAAHRLLHDLTDDPLQGVMRFREEVERYPGTLTQLRTQITSADTDLCGSGYSDKGKNADTEKWGKPYIYRELVDDELFVGIGVARNAIGREPAAGTPVALIIVVADVDERDARLLNTRADTIPEVLPASEGRVRWGTADGEGRVEMEWRREITSC